MRIQCCISRRQGVYFLCMFFFLKKLLLPLDVSRSSHFIIIIASHPCQGIGHRQTSSTHPCLELSCLEPPMSCQHLSFLFPCIFSMSPVAYPCLSSPADSLKSLSCNTILALPQCMSNPFPSTSAYFGLYWYLSSSFPQLFIYFIRPL